MKQHGCVSQKYNKVKGGMCMHAHTYTQYTHYWIQSFKYEKSG